MVVIFGWSFWAWVERRRERRRLARGEPAPTGDPTGWRQELGLSMSQSAEEMARVHDLEVGSYKAIHDRLHSHDESNKGGSS